MPGRFEFPVLQQEADRLLSNVGQNILRFRNEVNKLEAASRHALQLGMTRASTVFHNQRTPSKTTRHFNNFAGVSIGNIFKRGKQEKLKPEKPSLDRFTSKEILRRMTPEEREKLDQQVFWNLINKKDVKHKGKMLTAKEFEKAVDEEILRFQRSADIDTFKDLEKTYKYTDLLDRLPTDYFRGDAPKQQLRRKEERELELTRMTGGICDKGLFGGKQYSFGLFARPEDIAKHMIHWAKVDPVKAARNGEFFKDIMRVGREVELTLMVVPYKPLSIRKLQWEYTHKLRDNLKNMFGFGKPWKPMFEFLGLFNVERLSPAVWVNGSRVVPDTQLFFTTTDTGNLVVDAINPGPIKDQYTTFIGVTESPILTTAIFSLFLGKNPIDREAQEQFARAVIYLANGNTADPPNVDWRKFDASPMKDKTLIPLQERFVFEQSTET